MAWQKRYVSLSGPAFGAEHDLMENKMPVTISDDEYKEYMILRQTDLYQKKIASAKAQDTLENDIDLPIRRLVAMFALLGCDVRWSCCGFDYEGQPLHKSHEYGNLYLVFETNERLKTILNWLINQGVVTNTTKETIQWSTWEVKNFTYLCSDFDFDWNRISYPWSMTNSIHYSELAAISINILEKFLYALRENFADNAVLIDTNQRQKERVANWQYPILKPWIILKEYVIPQA